MKNLMTWLPPTLKMRIFGLLKVPLLFATSPKVRTLNLKTCEIEIPFRKIVKNHVGSMYFGALAIGAEASVGLLAVQEIESRRPLRTSFIFKEFQIEFLKRAEGPTVFICTEGDMVTETMDKAIASETRSNQKISGTAFCKGEEIAKYSLVLSLKKH